MTDPSQLHAENVERLLNIEFTLKEQNRELAEIKADGKAIKTQATLTNGRMTTLEKKMIIAFTAIAVTIALKFPELLVVLKLI